MNRSTRGWSVKRFERSNALDTVLYKNIPLLCYSTFFPKWKILPENQARTEHGSICQVKKMPNATRTAVTRSHVVCSYDTNTSRKHRCPLALLPQQYSHRFRQKNHEYVGLCLTPNREIACSNHQVLPMQFLNMGNFIVPTLSIDVFRKIHYELFLATANHVTWDWVWVENPHETIWNYDDLSSQ